MAEPSIFDLMTDNVKEVMSLTKAELRERFKKTHPYRQEPKSPKEMLVEYDELTPQKKQWLLEQFGEDSVLPYFAEMESIKKRYNRGVQYG